MRSGLFVCTILFVGSALSQESRGTLTGRISDSSGASVANAKLHALHQETNTGEGAGSDDSDLGGMGSGGRKEDTGQN